MAKYRDSVKISYQTSYLQIRTQQAPGFYRFQESIDTPQAEPEPGKDAVPSDYGISAKGDCTTLVVLVAGRGPAES